MADLATDARRVLLDLDVSGFLSLWPALFPAYPAPRSHDDALRTLHMARSGTSTIPMRLRHYSHKWLTDRGLPSSLPPEDQPKKVSAVGISVNSSHPQIVTEVRSAMEYAVNDAYADGRQDPDFVRMRMLEARKRARKVLGLPPLN